MDKFFLLLIPTEHTDLYSRACYRVEAATVDPDEVLYLHSDGKVKDGMIHLGNHCTNCDFTSLDKAYLAINDYYLAHGQTTPGVRGGGAWASWGRCSR